MALVVLMSATCFAGEAGKPACNRSNRGRFWPESANSDPQSLRKFAREGKLEVCSQAIWKYRWESLTVTVQQLSKPTREPEKASDTESAAGPASD